MASLRKQVEDKLANAKAQGQAQFDSIKEMIAELLAQRDSDYDGQDHDARDRITEDALSVQVRSGWYTPGPSDDESKKPCEYEILLCNGGPACRIIGDLRNGEPETATMEVQDWFQPWTEFRPSTRLARGDGDSAEATMLAYARCFYFGE